MKFSIITITYNSENTLRETIESVLEQTYRPLEYIIVDGGSSDNTLDIVSEYETVFRRNGITLSVKSEPDKGISDAFNKGILRSSGDIIGIINSDDKLAKDAISIVADEIDGSDVYYGKCYVFKNDSNIYIADPQKPTSYLKNGMPIYHPATFVTSKAYDKYGLFDVNLKYCMDRELLLRFYLAGAAFKKIDAPLAYYREGGVNQAFFYKNLHESTNVSIKYGMNIMKANLHKVRKILHFIVWRTIQKLGMERFFHSKV